MSQSKLGFCRATDTGAGVGPGIVGPDEPDSPVEVVEVVGVVGVVGETGAGAADGTATTGDVTPLMAAVLEVAFAVAVVIALLAIDEAVVAGAEAEAFDRWVCPSCAVCWTRRACDSGAAAAEGVICGLLTASADSRAPSTCAMARPAGGG